MKKWIIIAALFILSGVLGFFGVVFYLQYRDSQAHQAWLANAKDTASPSVAVWRDSVLIPYQNDKRTVHVYLPPGYASDTLRYPVIYLMDGDGCCSDIVNQAPEWRVDEVIDSVVAAGGPGAIVFGIESAEDRNAEYTPWPIDGVPQAHGEAYVNWLAGEFKPWVDANFRTLPASAATTIGGISRSGMMAYYAIASHPETFGNALIMSPSLWVDEPHLLAMESSAGPFADKRIMVTVGELEMPMVPQAKRIRDKLLSLGVPEAELQFHIVPGLGHEHLAWRKSFAMAYPWVTER